MISGTGQRPLASLAPDGTKTKEEKCRFPPPPPPPQKNENKLMPNSLKKQKQNNKQMPKTDPTARKKRRPLKDLQALLHSIDMSGLCHGTGRRHGALESEQALRCGIPSKTTKRRLFLPICGRLQTRTTAKFGSPPPPCGIRALLDAPCLHPPSHKPARVKPKACPGSELTPRRLKVSQKAIPNWPEPHCNLEPSKNHSFALTCQREQKHGDRSGSIRQRP